MDAITKHNEQNERDTWDVTVKLVIWQVGFLLGVYLGYLL
jgi:hypothetical protein